LVKKSSAFTMIELVFAIVIIGIVVTAIPTLISINQKNQQQAVVSEGIFALSAKMLQDSTYYWDTCSTDASHSLANVLDIQNCAANSACDDATMRVSGTVYRIGHTDELGTTTHRHFYTTDPTYAKDLASNESVNTRAKSSQTALITKSSDRLGYKQSFKYTMSVKFVKDNTFAATSAGVDTNVKMMEYKLYKVNADATTTQVALMRNFVCNIGEADYYKVVK